MLKLGLGNFLKIMVNTFEQKKKKKRRNEREREI